MKMRKKLAALLAAAMIASVMPMTAFAASTNTVTRVVKVAKDTKLVQGTPGAKEARAPQLKIELKDGFKNEEEIYLTLGNAEWDAKAIVEDSSKMIDIVSGVTTNSAIQLIRTGDKKLTVKSNGNINTDGVFYINLLTVLKGGEATIDIDGEGSNISSGEIIFATAPDAGVASKIVVGDPDNFSEKGSVASITIEEPFQGAYLASNKDLVFELDLRDSDFEFVPKVQDLTDPDSAEHIKGTRVEGSRGFAGFTSAWNGTNGTSNKANGSSNVTDVKLEFSDKNTNLKITIPHTELSATTRGNLELKDLGIKRVSRSAAKGDVKVTMRGDFVDGSETVVIAKHTDFTTKLEMKKEYEVETGKEVDVEFTLSEELSKSLVQNRAITFSLSKGAKFKSQTSYDNAGAKQTNAASGIEAKAKAKTTNDDYQTTQYLDADSSAKHNSFELIDIAPDAGEKAEYNFKATILVPNNFDGDEVKLIAEGKALSDTHEVVAAKVKRPVTVEVTPMDVKVGLKQQTGGEIVIKENAKEAILRNYKDAANNSIATANDPATIDIVIADDYGTNTDGLRITDADIEVTDGDLVLDLDAQMFTGGTISIPVKRQSTEPSTITIKNIVVDATRNVPEGKYSIKVGGNALSKNTELYEFVEDRGLRTDVIGGRYFDPIAMVDLINITTKNTEDFTGITSAEVNFVVGSSQYLVNGEAKDMDAAAYVKDGRTMVPVRYVAGALGITEDKIVWEGGAAQTATILADKVIQVKLGSKTMVVNGANVPMTAAAEIKDGRTFVPVAEIARALGVSVNWDEATKTATFNAAK